jgi:hypothetical protein
MPYLGKKCIPAPPPCLDFKPIAGIRLLTMLTELTMVCNKAATTLHEGDWVAMLNELKEEWNA